MLVGNTNDAAGLGDVLEKFGQFQYAQVNSCNYILFVAPLHALKQDDPALSGRILFGVIKTPPFDMKTFSEQWKGQTTFNAVVS